MPILRRDDHHPSCLRVLSTQNVFRKNATTLPWSEDWPVNSSSLVRFLPVSQYLLALASGVRVLDCGVLTSREA